jgi:hypothetical protein
MLVALHADTVGGGKATHDRACGRQDVLQRVGSRGAAADVARSLCAKLAPTLLAPAAVAALAAAREDAGPGFVRAALALLADAAAAAPSLFAGLLEPVRASLPPLGLNCGCKNKGRSLACQQIRLRPALALHQPAPATGKSWLPSKCALERSRPWQLRKRCKPFHRRLSVQA